MRFPAYNVETLSDGYRVIIQDVRYTRTSGVSPGTAIVELDHDLRVRATRTAFSTVRPWMTIEKITTP